VFRQWTIAWRLTLFMVLGAGCILGAVVGYSYYTAQRLLEEELETKSHYLALATANRMEAVERAVAKATDGLAAVVEEHPTMPEDELYRLMHKVVAPNEEIYGTAVAFAPSPNGKFHACYVFRQKDRLQAKEVSYQFDKWEWYTEPRDRRQPVWSEPYFGQGGGILMVTYSVPIFIGKEKRFFGIVESDVSLAWLTDLLRSLPMGKSGYGFLITKNGTYIAHPKHNLVLNETVFSVARQLGKPELEEVGRRMVSGETGFVALKSVFTGRPSWMAYTPVPSTGWSLALVFPKDELLERVARLHRIEVALGIIGFIFLLGVALGIAHSITSPLRQLESSTHTLAAGNLDAPLPAIAGGDEVARLAASFTIMRDNLQTYIADLTATTAAKERIESEVHIARSIQMGLVPKTFPPFPERNDIDLYAMLEPAREIGGDFYDFYFIDDDHICLVIADVSGKGIPAALFMAVTRTLLKSIWRDETDPAAALGRLNHELALDNESSMFVTLFCAIIQLSTGECDYASGGHTAPFLLAPDGAVASFPRVKGTLVGAVEGVHFDKGRLQLRHGDTVLFYTDGVTEAMNPAGELFGEERALDALARLGGKTSMDIIAGIRQTVREFAGGAEQSDDITMLAFRYTAGEW